MIRLVRCVCIRVATEIHTTCLGLLCRSRSDTISSSTLCGNGSVILLTLASAFLINADEKLNPTNETDVDITSQNQNLVLVGHLDAHDFPEHERCAPQLCRGRSIWGGRLAPFHDSP